MKKELFIEIITGLLIILFLYTSFSKLFDIWYFKYDLAKQPFPNWLKEILLWAIPYSEIGISILLFFKRARKAGFIASLLLMVMFTGYTAAILLNFFPYVPCGCGGVIRILTWPQHLVFNLFFLVLIIIGIKLQKMIANEKIVTMPVRHL